MNKQSSWLKQFDWFIVLPAIYLVVIGLVIQLSIANKTSGIDLDINMYTQVIAIMLAIVAGALFKFLQVIKKPYLAGFGYLLGVLLLVLVLLVGATVNGSQRWLNLAGLQLQPTELAKLGLIFLLALTFSGRDISINRVRTIFWSFVYTVIPVALIIAQPDLGSSIVLFVVWITIIFASRIKLSKFAFVIVTIIASIIILIPFMAQYQQERLVSYFNPSHDIAGASYNVLQADIAIGSGGLLGTGIDSGSQSQLNFLPSQHTDFIFAVTSEKLGLVGALSVILAFLAILIRISYLSWVSTNQFERALLVGIGSMLFFHIFVNIGMNLSLVPVTGLPLPLLSYGGTFTFVTILSLIIVGLISDDIKLHQNSTL